MDWLTEFYGRETTLQNYIQPNPSTGSSLRQGYAGQAGRAGKKAKDKKEDKVKKPDKKTKTWSKRAKQLLATDNQLRAAINLINLLHVAQTCCPDKVKNREEAVSFLNQNFITDKKIKMEEVHI